MANKVFNTRLQQKRATQAQWEAASSFIPLAGEIIIYEPDGNYNYPRMKVGDGTHTVAALPFVTTTVNGKIGAVNLTAQDVGADEEGSAAAALGVAREEMALKEEGAFFIEGTGTTDSTAKTSTWTGESDRITSYYDGLTIRYKIGVAGQATTTLNINGLGAKTVYRFGTSKLTTHFPVGSIIHLIYHADLNGGCWMCSDYDANTNTYQRLYESSAKDVEYPITARYTTTTGNSYYAEYGRYSDEVTLNPSTNTITASTFKGNLEGTAAKATADAEGNVISSTYATKEEIPEAATDPEILSMMLEEDALPVVQTEDGFVLCSAENEILMI